MARHTAGVRLETRNIFAGPTPRRVTVAILPINFFGRCVSSGNMRDSDPSGAVRRCINSVCEPTTGYGGEGFEILT
jgi:hypothetical protein